MLPPPPHAFIGTPFLTSQSCADDDTRAIRFVVLATDHEDALAAVTTKVRALTCV